MPENFQQTVDLRERTEKRRPPAAPKKAATPLEKIYQGEEAGRPKEDLRKISRPEIGPLRRSLSQAGEASRPRGGLIKLIVFILAILAVSAAVYFLFFRQRSAGQEPLARDWYAVKSADGMVYYGQIFDLKADPITIANVYYDYDRDKAIKEKKIFTETGNLRLVKMGKEVQGGNGNMLVYPNGGWPIMEPLRSSSKVLQAILEYEK